MSRNPTALEVDYLTKYNIPLHQVLDLNGGSVGPFEDQMKAEHKLFGYNGSSCTKGMGHTLLSRAGRCIQCNTANITFMRREHDKGDVYLLGSVQTSLIKIGSTIVSVASRVSRLNAVAYGSSTDWESLLIARDLPCAGEVEGKIHSKLAEFRIGGLSYRNSDREQVCYELFSCSLKTAMDAFISALPKDVKPAPKLGSVLAKYTFPDRPTDTTSRIKRIGNRR